MEEKKDNQENIKTVDSSSETTDTSKAPIMEETKGEVDPKSTNETPNIHENTQSEKSLMHINDITNMNDNDKSVENKGIDDTDSIELDKGKITENDLNKLSEIQNICEKISSPSNEDRIAEKESIEDKEQEELPVSNNDSENVTECEQVREEKSEESEKVSVPEDASKEEPVESTETATEPEKAEVTQEVVKDTEHDEISSTTDDIGDNTTEKIGEYIHPSENLQEMEKTGDETSNEVPSLTHDDNSQKEDTSDIPRDTPIEDSQEESKDDDKQESQTDEQMETEPTETSESEKSEMKKVASPVLVNDESSSNANLEAPTKQPVVKSIEQMDTSIPDDKSHSFVQSTDDNNEDEPSNIQDVSEGEDRSMEENPVFVHVNSEKKEATKNPEETEQEPADEAEVETVTEEDPIGVGIPIQIEKDDSMEFEETNLEREPLKVVDKNVIEDLVSGKGADEELCIIPDTEREISQEEKDAATAAVATNKTDFKKSPVKSAETEIDKNNASKPNSPTEPVSSSSDKKAKSPITTLAALIEHYKTSASSTYGDMIPVEVMNETEGTQMCWECETGPHKCVYSGTHADTTFYLCTNECFERYRQRCNVSSANVQTDTPEDLDNGDGVTSLSTSIMASPTNQNSNIPSEKRVISKTFVRKCAECSSKIMNIDDKILTWETMEFCHEDCLSKYQSRIGSHCANCTKTVNMSSLGKYCVRFGHDIRQFCSSVCLEEFKKGLKVCSYCQKDISAGPEGFLAPVGDKGQFKDFCSQLCMENFDVLNNKTGNSQTPVERGSCAVCLEDKPLPIVFEQTNNKHKFCSEHPCFVAFKFVNNADPLLCDMCKKYFEKDNCTEFSIHTDGGTRNFCCKTCQNIHIIATRKIVPCSWCKVKKYNFDMIKKICATGQTLNMCSLNCLSLFQVSVNAVNAKKLKCDFCQQTIQAQYHLTMSDATLRNFCSYQCVMSFQEQFPSHPITSYSETITRAAAPVPTPAGPPRRNYATRNSRPEQDLPLPVITSVQSLANQDNSQEINKERNQPVVPAPPVAPVVKQQVIIKNPPKPQMKNKSTSVRPIMKTKAVSCNVLVSHKETQTDEQREKVRIVPVPVPIYVPAPLHMFSRPLPIPVPFPLPIPVPIFVPTTRNSAAGIMKEIKKIQVKIPTDPFEAELLMMAEMVAGEKKIDHTDSESEDDDHAGSTADAGFSPEAVDTSNTFGDDMLQMALKMATELDEPAVDLEGALTANTITASQNAENQATTPEEAVDDPQPMHAHHALIDRNQAMRGRKRTVRQGRGGSIGPSKRGRRLSSNVDMPMMPPPQPSQPPEPVEKPDANMCLKYTFGVNAWKQWVTTKNAELEKSSRRIKLFKNEILQLTADELNYSLCLFVKEVRKPNGTEYAPDTIYYLCLGIQQYLFENGRIDNIFTDAYYEKFTDCLDEVARKFSVLYNDSHYIVTRVEEEHLWESKQLGAHSPHVLLSTLMFFNTKHFNLTTVDEHMQLSFSHIMKHWKRNPNQPGAAKVPGSRNVLLRFYPPQTTLDNNARKKKVYEQQENEENPLRCPVKLYEFYLSKCPESVKTRNDVFYLLPERSCVPDSPVWYSTMALGKEALEKMLHRVKMVKEINVALLTS